MLDYEGHIQVTDFGLAKRNVTTPNGATTFVGSPEYVAPEVLARGRYGFGYGKAVDWWSLGTLIYEMLNGIPPFYDRNKQTMFEQIQYAKLVFPQHFGASAQCMLKGLLTRDPKDRLGSGDEGSNDIRSSPFFTTIDWAKLEQRLIIPPWVPKESTSITDTSNFDTRGVSMASPGKSVTTRGTVSPVFSGFTYRDQPSLLNQNTDFPMNDDDNSTNELDLNHGLDGGFGGEGEGGDGGEMKRDHVESKSELRMALEQAECALARGKTATAKKCAHCARSSARTSVAAACSSSTKRPPIGSDR